jgi:hypothetical protein
MLIERLAGLGALGLVALALPFRRAMREPTLGGAALGFAAGGALARHAQVDNLSHAGSRPPPHASECASVVRQNIDVNCADSVANRGHPVSATMRLPLPPRQHTVR